jgi:excisionase family DNA binding protein
MLTLDELCEWLNITELHGRKLVERDAIPYRKIGHLLRFPEAEIEEWSHPAHKSQPSEQFTVAGSSKSSRKPSLSSIKLPKSLIE